MEVRLSDANGTPGSATSYAISALASSLHAADVDGDKRIDVIVVTQGLAADVYRNQGGGVLLNRN